MSSTETAPIVVKVSGSLVDDSEGMSVLWDGLHALQSEAPVVLVHGGGQQMTKFAARLGHTPKRVQGRRVTTDLDLEIAQWTMGGELNTRLVAQAQAEGLSAVGLSGADAGQIRVSKRPPWTIEGETVDFGWVGDIEAVDPSLLTGLLGQGRLPIVAPLGVGEAGQVYNVNADTVASALARALSADRLCYVTGTGGVCRTTAGSSSRLETCDAATFEEGVAEGWIDGGMRVKIETALEALQDGVEQAVVCAADDLIEQGRATRIVL